MQTADYRGAQAMGTVMICHADGVDTRLYVYYVHTYTDIMSGLRAHIRMLLTHTTGGRFISITAFRKSQ